MTHDKLRAHLVRLYILTVALTLLAVLTAAVLLFTRETRAQNREVFSALLYSISDRLRENETVNHGELAEAERANNLMLRVRDKTALLTYNANDSAQRAGLFDRTETLARGDGYDVSQLPLTALKRVSPVYAFAENGRDYLGAVCIMPVDNGCRYVTMVQRAKGAGGVWLFLPAYLIGVAVLSLIGVMLIDRALLPAMESRKRQTQFIAAASHELRAPLAVISASAATIERQAGGAGAVIGRECERMARLVSDMLLLASVDGKSWPVHITQVEIDTLLMNAYEACEPLFHRQKCTLTLTLPDEATPRVWADEQRLSQVIEILLDNALSYGMREENRNADLTLEIRGKQALVRVIDHGPGMTNEQKARAFERFYRGDAARKDKQHFGLGLSIASELIALQKGRLSLSDTPGGGCTFEIRIG